MELLEDYDIIILYHPGKASVAVDALSQKASSMGSLAFLKTEERSFPLEIHSLSRQMVQLYIYPPHSVLAFIEVRSTLIDQIHAHQFDNEN